MKNKFKNFFCSILALAFILLSCEQEGPQVYDGETLLSFQTATFNSVLVPSNDLTLEVPVLSSSASTSDRTFNAVITSASESTSNEYSVGVITIPAGEYVGILTIDFDFSEISGGDGEIKQLVVSIDPPAGTSTYRSEVTINYFKEIVCNDLTIEIISDVWADETYWTLKQADGTVLVDRFSPFNAPSLTPQVYTFDFFLPNGDYILEIGDVWGDGMVGSAGGVTLVGSYALTCSIITHASGGGALSGAVPDPFPGAPNAIVQVTAFTVNP